VYSVGALAIAPSDHDVLWLGSGEGDPRNSTSFGNGVYRSTDGGRSWTHLGLEGTERIKRIEVDPRNPDVAYVCAMGHAWGPNDDRGVFRTADGGKTWQKVLFVDQDTGCSDIAMDAANPRILYAAMWTFRRRPWRFDDSGERTALHRTTDGGATWTKLTNGLPKGPMARIGVATSQSHPATVYLVTETKTEGVLFRSDDRGESWRKVHDDPNINFRPFYYSDLRADPRNPNVVYSLSGTLYKSQDGGRTFQSIGTDIHGDHQGMWIDPTDADYILEGSDGGWQVSYDAGRTWEVVNTISFAQFYHLNLDLEKPYNICGGLQDNGHWCGPSRTLSNQGNRKNSWVTISGGDGFFAVPDLAQPHLVYSASQGGNIVLTDTRTGDQRSIHPYPRRVGSAGDSLAEHKYRFNWNAAIALDPSDSRTVYFGGNVLFRSRNYGQSWDVISPDLSTNDKKKQGSSGGPIVTDNTAAEFHSTILTIAPSPKDPKVIWVGTDDGNVQVTRDGGGSWTNTVRNIRDLPANAWISTIDASPHDAGTALVAASHWQTGDYTPYPYITRDYGQTWTRVSGNLPARGWVHVVRQDPRNPNLLYAGTEFGVFASWNQGRQWHSIRNGISAAPVRDLLVHPRDNDLVIATHGRGLYILDDLTPLQKLGEAMAGDLTLFNPPPAVRWVMWSADGNLGRKVWRGENPPFGAVISYFVRDTVRGLRFTIKDGQGRVIRTLRDSMATPGVHRRVWDLRYDATPAGELVTAGGPGGGGGGGGGGFGGFGGGGPMVVPGSYTVTLAAGGKELTQPLTVELDPRGTASLADLVAQRDAALELRDLSARANGIVARTGNLMQQLTGLGTTLRQNAPAERAAIDETRGAMDEIRDFRDRDLARPIQGLGYRQYPRLREEVQSLSGAVNRSQSRPTDAQMLRKAELEAEIGAAEVRLNAIINGRIAKINAMLKNLPHIVVAGGGIS